MFSIFRKKEIIPTDVPSLLVDIHSHLIPGIDDGSQSEAESIELIRMMKELGFKKAITTPHIMTDTYKNTEASVTTQLELLKKTLLANAIQFEMQVAAEYYLDEFLPQKLLRKELLTFGGENKFVLFELPMNIRPLKYEDFIFNLNLEGYKPVLAHPERYTFFHDAKLIDYEKLKNMGVLFQLNLVSLTGHYTVAIRDIARELIEEGWIDFVGTDVHRQKHLEAVRIALKDKYYLKLAASGKLLNNSL